MMIQARAKRYEFLTFPILIGCLILLLAGCSHIHGPLSSRYPRVQPLFEAPYEDSEYFRDHNEYSCAIWKHGIPDMNGAPEERKTLTRKSLKDNLPECPPPTPGDDKGLSSQDRLKAAISSPNESERMARLARNNMIGGVEADIQQQYDRFRDIFLTGKGLEGVSGDFVQLGLTAASVITPAARTKTIFSALATAVTGLNLSIDNNFFNKQTYSVIAVAMETRRERYRDEIRKHLNDSTTDYPWTMALGDLARYYGAGSLASGLLELQEEAGKAAKTQQAESAKTVLKMSSASDLIPADGKPLRVVLSGDDLSGIDVQPIDRAYTVKNKDLAANNKTFSFDISASTANPPQEGDVAILVTTKVPGVGIEIIHLRFAPGK